MSDLGGTMNKNLRDKIVERLLSKAERSYGWSAWAAADEIADLVGPELDRLRAEVKRAYANYSVQHDRADRAKAERDDLRARLAKVERALMQGGQTDRVRWCAAVEALASVPEPSDERAIPKRCPRCGEECRYDGWDWTHASGYGVGSCPEPSDSEPHAPCCDACGGSGASDEASSNGLCWDCRGTGCAHEPSEPAPDAAAFALKVAEQQMCPNCVTPWKCNGPHIEQPAPDADREAGGE